MRSASHVLFVSLALAACDASSTTAVDAGDVAVDAGLDASSVMDESAADRLSRYLTGSFASTAQSERDAMYFDIRLAVCPVDAPELGPRVLYVEQAVAGSESAPYRQRLYVVEPAEAAGSAVSRVFELADPASFVGQCARAERRSVSATEASEKVGCAVTLAWDGEHFEGGTTGTGCASERSGASYTSSEVTLDERLLASWDRGFDAAGMQVWGATAGPYEFDRIGEVPSREGAGR